MKFAYIVQIHNALYNTKESARVFTLWDDAQTFIETCKEVDSRSIFTYSIDKIELDGDPKGTY